MLHYTQLQTYFPFPLTLQMLQTYFVIQVMLYCCLMYELEHG